MGKKKRDEMVSGSGGSETVVETSKRPRKETAKPETNATKPKKLNNASDKVAKSVPSKEVTKPVTAPVQPTDKNSKSQNMSSDSSSSSESESEKQSAKNEKKCVSDSNSDSGSESSDSESSPTSREEPNKGSKEKPVKSKEAAVNQVNSVTNLIPAKTYAPSPMTTDSSDSYHSDTEEEDKKRRKKQKKMLQMQMTKRVRRNAVQPKTSEIKQEVSSDMEEDGGDNSASNTDEVPAWPENDYSELLRRMEAQIPQKDYLKFDSRAAKLDWTKIAFNNYTPDECMEVWLAISRRIRRFRTLAEMLVDARGWVSKPWTNFYRGVKKNRHPDMPTRPLSTYMLYYMEHKDKIATLNPDFDMMKVSKKISEMYKNLSSEERDKYMEMAAQQRQDFDTRLMEFYKEHPDLVQHQQPKRTHKEVTPKGPKKASNPFKLFFQDQLKLLGGDTGKDKKTIEEFVKEKWRGLSDKKKLHYIDLALQDHNRYEDEMKVYKINHPEYVPPITSKPILNKDERNIKERLAGKPVKPPNSAYSLFSRVMLQSDPDVKSLPPKQRMALISKKWKEMTNNQKSQFEARVRTMQEAYKLEFASYLENLSPEDREEELRKSQPKRKRPEKTEKKQKKNAGNKAIKKELDKLNLFKGEPEPPPVRVFDVFLQSFQPEKSRGLKEEDKLKEALKSWNSLSEAKKESYRKKHDELKQKYIKDFEIFLKSLSPDELKEFSLMKELAKKNKEAKVQRELINGNVADSNAESDDDDNASSSDSDSGDSDSGKSSKSTSSSEDSG